MSCVADYYDLRCLVVNTDIDSVLICPGMSGSGGGTEATTHAITVSFINTYIHIVTFNEYLAKDTVVVKVKSKIISLGAIATYNTVEKKQPVQMPKIPLRLYSIL